MANSIENKKNKHKIEQEQLISGVFSKSLWSALRAKAISFSSESLQTLLEQPSSIERAEAMRLETEGFYFDYSRSFVDEELLALGEQALREMDFAGRREELFCGEKINQSEERAVLHTLLRAGERENRECLARNLFDEVAAVREQFLAFSERIRRGEQKTITGKPFSSVICFGIGGSSLGVELGVTALSAVADGPTLYFLPNPDFNAVQQVIKTVDLASTLVVIASKTFTTQETMVNAEYMKQVMTQKFSSDIVSKHFVGLSANLDAMKAFGITEEHMFPLWDFVGGRFSLWSCVGLPLAIAIGAENFRAFLRGAETMDRHFREQPFRKNLPLLLSWIHFFNVTFMGMSTRAVIPYSEALKNLPRHLQQLEMESNGKSIDLAGQAIAYPTAPIVWGEPGTGAQHSFFQLLHQGQNLVPVDFIGVASPHSGRDEEYVSMGHEHANILSSHLVAQSEALALGVSPKDLARRCIGGKPSTILMLKELSPSMLGALIALYEHKVFAEGVFWNINSFDQWGVELGKSTAKATLAFLTADEMNESSAADNNLSPAAKDLLRWIHPS